MKEYQKKKIIKEVEFIFKKHDLSFGDVFEILEGIQENIK